MSEEKYPVSDFFTVLDAIDIYKTEKWWKAVLAVKSKYGIRIATYQWLKDNKTGKWKRKQKMGVKDMDELNKIYTALKKLLESNQGNK